MQLSGFTWANKNIHCPKLNVPYINFNHTFLNFNQFCSTKPLTRMSSWSGLAPMEVSTTSGMRRVMVLVIVIVMVLQPTLVMLLSTTGIWHLWKCLLCWCEAGVHKSNTFSSRSEEKVKICKGVILGRR